MSGGAPPSGGHKAPGTAGRAGAAAAAARPAAAPGRRQAQLQGATTGIPRFILPILPWHCGTYSSNRHIYKSNLIKAICCFVYKCGDQFGFGINDCKSLGTAKGENI